MDAILYLERLKKNILAPDSKEPIKIE